MKKAVSLAIALAAVAISVVPARAHVTVKPAEAVAGGFQTFTLQVPNERDDASTIKLQVRFPQSFAFVSFQDVDGWKRDVKTVKFDEPVEAFGQEVTEGVGTVAWTGGRIGPGEFELFPFSAGPVPSGEIAFEAIQTYDSGEVVRWTGAADADQPAPRALGVDLGAEEGQGELSVIADLQGDVADLRSGLQAANDHMAGRRSEGSDDDEGSDALPLAVAGAGTGLGLIALLVALGSRRREG